MSTLGNIIKETRELAAIGFIMQEDFCSGRIDEEIPDDKELAHALGYEDAKLDILQFLKERGCLGYDANDLAKE